jgi:hypothetical protein
MPVPRPGQCSHRIQVTQRTRYLEVTAKVDILTSQDTVPTPLHSYTSGIGLSLMSLPWYIQRFAGDIPAIPTLMPFEFDEPVDMIIATDESVPFGVGYHEWVLATKNEINLLRGGGSVDGIE